MLSVLAAGTAEAMTGYKAGSGEGLPLAVIAANVLALWAALVAAALYASRRRGSGSLAADFGFRVGAWWDLPLGVAIGLACQYGLVALIYLPFEQLDHNLSRHLGEPAHRDTAAAHTAPALAALLVLLAVGAPLVEELFFRGLLLRSLAGWAGSGGAIALSAVLFGLAHFEALQFPGLAAFGVILAVLARVTGRLGPSVGAHMAFNAVAVLTSVHLR